MEDIRSKTTMDFFFFNLHIHHSFNKHLLDVCYERRHSSEQNVYFPPPWNCFSSVGRQDKRMKYVIFRVCYVQWRKVKQNMGIGRVGRRGLAANV